MIVSTTRFGDVQIEDARLIHFAKGLLGFAQHKDYVLIEAAEDSSFWWLQSVDAPDLAFVVTDPGLFVPTCKVPVREETMEELGVQAPEDVQVFVIVNKRDNMLTGNLQGPLVVNARQRNGQQLVLSDRRFTTRVPLVELGQPAVAQSA